MHAFYRSWQLQQVRSCPTRARVDPQAFCWYFLSASKAASAHHCLDACPHKVSKTIVRTRFSSIDCTHSKEKYYVAICRQTPFPGGATVGVGDHPTRSEKRGRRTVKRTPAPPSSVAAEASPPWNSAMSRTM